ncbi:hypothetical protein NQ651_17390 [Acinetobacter baumannii]|nr:hypothetical protein [Acinetobacter baumannii]
MALKISTQLELDWLKWLQTQFEYTQNTRGVALQSVQCIIQLDADGKPTFGVEAIPVPVEAPADTSN